MDNLDKLYKVCDDDKSNIVMSFDTVAECMAYIRGRIDEKGFKCYYYNIWEIEEGLVVDYGSHSHFYYILNAKIGNM